MVCGRVIPAAPPPCGRLPLQGTSRATPRLADRNPACRRGSGWTPLRCLGFGPWISGVTLQDNRLPGRRSPNCQLIKSSSRKTLLKKIVYRVDENAKKSVYRKKSGTQDKEGVMWAFSGKTEPFPGENVAAAPVYPVDDRAPRSPGPP